MQGTGEKMNLNQKLQSIAYEKILKMPGTKYKFANMVHAEIRLKFFCISGAVGLKLSLSKTC